jgi:hypothetical protein
MNRSPMSSEYEMLLFSLQPLVVHVTFFSKIFFNGVYLYGLVDRFRKKGLFMPDGDPVPSLVL